MRIIFSILLVLGFSLPLQASSTDTSTTFAERRLVSIHERQERLLNEIENTQDASASDTLQRRMQQLIADYESFIADNPENIDALVLYGRLLRQIGERDHAQLVFLRANQLNDALHVVKQQIGNYLAEEGKYTDALGFYLQAINLAPETALYHYQLGEVLATFRDFFIDDGILDSEAIDSQILAAFRNASELDSNRVLAERYAQAFYDIEHVDWNEALAAWDALLHGEAGEQARQVVHLNRANILIQLNREDDARNALDNVVHPALQQPRQQILELLD